MIPEGALRQLKGTKPWVRLISVVIFIGAAFMLLAAAGILLISMVSGANLKPGFPAQLSGGMGIGIAAIYALMSMLYIYPGMKLWKYANRIGALMISGSWTDFEDALDQQRSFWKFAGVMMAVILSLYFLIIVGALLVGLFAGFSSRGV